MFKKYHNNAYHHAYVLFTVLKEQALTRADLTKALNAVMRMRKYAFLYATPQIAATNIKHTVLVYVINKIETYARYTYPTVNKTTDTTLESEQDAVSNSPYRTVSHYGFNYPLAYMPSVPLYPHNLNTISDDFVADLHLQRNLVVEFLKSATLKLRAHSKESFVSVKEIHFTSPSSCNETETEEEPNYTTVKKLHLMPSNKRKRAWLRTTSTCSSNAQTATTSSAAYLEEGETSGLCSLSTHFDDADYSAGSCASLPCPPPPTPSPPPPPPAPPLPSKSFLKSEKPTVNKQEKPEARTSVKAEINATQQTLDLSISVHINQNQWGAAAFHNLAQIIESEMQILSQQFTQKTDNNAATSAITATKAHDNHMAQNFQLLEQELEKLLNSILCVNALTQNLRTAYNETE